MRTIDVSGADSSALLIINDPTDKFFILIVHLSLEVYLL